MNKKAFTLIEVIISAILISLIMVAATNLFITAKRYVIHNRARMTGGEFGKFFLDPLQQQVVANQWGENYLSTGNIALTPTPNPETIDRINYSANYTVDADNVSGTEARRVIVNISWDEPKP